MLWHFGRRLQDLLRLLQETVREFRKDNCSQIAAAMSYKSVLSLVPILAIFLSVAAAHPVFAEKRM